MWMGGLGGLLRTDLAESQTDKAQQVPGRTLSVGTRHLVHFGKGFQ